eukprot:COSAG01_NODE_1331_length_10699_cov_28.574717_8_plen_85_part_00
MDRMSDHSTSHGGSSVGNLSGPGGFDWLRDKRSSNRRAAESSAGIRKLGTLRVQWAPPRARSQPHVARGAAAAAATHRELMIGT